MTPPSLQSPMPRPHGPRHRNRQRPKPLLVLAAAAVLLLGACSGGSSSPSSSTEGPASTDQPKVVASTSWVAAFAVAAGIEDVSIVAPVDLQHPPDYDPKPSDLAAIADADVVLLAGFEGFADRLTDAAGGGAEVVTLQVDNTPDNIRTQVRALGERFGTEAKADAWITRFDGRVEALRTELAEAVGDREPTAVAHTFMAYWADLAGIEVVGTWGPQPVSASELAAFTAAEPDLVLLNAHVPAGGAFDDLGAVGVEIRNFPDDSLDLIEVFEANAAALVDAFAELAAG